MLKKEWLEIRVIKKKQLLIERAKKLLRKLKNQKKQNIMKQLEQQKKYKKLE